MKRILFGFMLAMMTLGGYAQVQAGAKLDKGNAALKKDNGMTKQELTTGKAGNNVELQDKAFASTAAKVTNNMHIMINLFILSLLYFNLTHFLYLFIYSF